MTLVSVSIRMTKADKKELDAIAARQRRTRSAVILRGIELAGKEE